MRTYQDIDIFNEWSDEEKNQFALAVTKGLIMDTVRKANSGHSGGPMSSADFTQILFTEYLKFDPNDPDWFNRDRFVLSAGHESALIYAMLTQIGWLNIEDIQNFRQLHSRTPGHPEVETPGVEATTGPLGQGFGMAVGMATAESMLRARVGELVDHFTYVLAGDGDFQEPITLGAGSMAGHWGLSRLIVYYDSNNAQISGKVDRADSTNYAQVFEGFGWHVQEINGHNHEEISNAISLAKKNFSPTLISCKTKIGFGSPNKESNSSSHGSPLGEEEIELTRKNLNWPYGTFELPDDLVETWRNFYKRTASHKSAWGKHNHRLKSSPQYKEFFSKLLGTNVKEVIVKFKDNHFNNQTNCATRKASELSLEIITPLMKNLIGGSADLTGSNNTKTKNMEIISKKKFSGTYIHYGIREHGMVSIMNGMALHGGIKP